MADIIHIVVFVKALVLPLGIGITVLAYRAYRRTGSAAMRSFALGFGVVTLGGILGGGLDRLLGVSVEVGLLVNGVLTAVGFAILARSLYVTESRPAGAETDLPSDG